MSRKWLVAGGGISGLAAAQCLQANNRDYLLLERCPALGGLTRTTQVEDFCFDYTGHFLHLRRFGSPSKIPYAHLNDEDWETVERKSYFFGGGRLITAPIQYHLGELPDDLRSECEASYDARPKAEGDISGFREFIISGFGQAVADKFLIPQNETQNPRACSRGELLAEPVMVKKPPRRKIVPPASSHLSCWRRSPVARR